MDLEEGNFFVFEGLDGTGKSTQMLRMHNVFADSSPRVYFTHQPSGESDFTRTMYLMLENHKPEITNPLAKQLVHLACHAEHYESFIKPILRNHALFMDRCWWSTFAYGWEVVKNNKITEEEWLAMCTLPTQGMHPNVIFYFPTVYKADANNNPHIQKSYEWLASHPGAITVPDGKPQEQEDFIVHELQRLRFC